MRSLSAIACVLLSLGCHYNDRCDDDRWDDDDDFCERTGLCRDGGTVAERDGGTTEERDAPVPIPIGCRSSAECDAGELCVAGDCRPEGDICRSDVDCGAGRGCVDGACRPYCASDAECGGGTCTDGRCDPSTECRDGLDCAEGEICLHGDCTIGCETAADCAGDEVCELGACRPDVAPRPFCVEDADCAPGHPCVDGVCRTTCPTGTAEECQLADVQFIECASVGDLFLCLSRPEAAPECVTEVDCEAGRHCVDASCR